MLLWQNYPNLLYLCATDITHFNSPFKGNIIRCLIIIFTGLNCLIYFEESYQLI